MSDKHAYTAEQVDEQIRKLEQSTERQIATMTSAVKGVAAERDLLSSAEGARDLLLKAVKGEKEWLDKVFGGSCERIGRLRLPLDRVRLSPMHENDKRWKNLRDSVETVEAVLKDLGTFKPWTPPSAKAPERVSYKGLRRRLSPGRRIMLKPEIEGGEAATFTVEPPLPAGLELSPTTGAISGQLVPGLLVDEATYVVIARNEAGEVRTELVFSVKETPPASLSYPSIPADILQGQAVSWEPEFKSGLTTEWSVSPALPDGLSLDPVSGVIRGAATKAAEFTEYEVSLANSGGKAVAVIKFLVRSAAPRAPVYDVPADGIVLVLGAPVALAPEATPGTSFAVRPELPAGLTLNEATGLISGTPSAPSGMTRYEVTSSNSGGEASCAVLLQVELVAPSALSYPQLPERIWTFTEVSVTPQVTGVPSSWSVTPDLPAELSLDSSRGVISGTPSSTLERNTWTVVASNEWGETACQLTFSVEHAPPSGLHYPSLEKEYLLLHPVLLEPSVVGVVDKYSVAPPLPAGLQLDELTGIINGAPSEVTSEESYEVTASSASGETSTSLSFAVRMAPPSSLEYPGLSSTVTYGEEVSYVPQVQGGPTHFEVSPELPVGLELDEQTGTITGASSALLEASTFVITASNEAGQTTVEVTFAVVPPLPEDLMYPLASSTYAIGEPVYLEPQFEGSIGVAFTVEPNLPEGLELDVVSGVISGAPAALSDETTYVVVATNASGSTSVEFKLQVIETVQSEEVAGSIDTAFAERIEAVTDIAELLPEPIKTKSYGDWMIWMVHRAFLNDPELVDFNFSNLQMPPPHIEARIAPKLMKAMETNTHIKVLCLPNSNLQKAQGHQLAEALRTNRTLKSLNVECNCLDSESVRVLAVAMASNPECKLEFVRVSKQKHVGNFFGRPVEEAFGQLMDKNETITKLSFECNDPHWRNMIDRALLRNNDLARRRRRSLIMNLEEAEMVQAEDKALSRLVLQLPPTVPVSQVFAEDSGPHLCVRGFVAAKRSLPTSSQLQSYAKNNGTPLKYSIVAPLIKECRSKMLDAAVNTEVTVADIFEVDIAGKLRSWSIVNDNWTLDIWAVGGKRYTYKSSKEPALLVSDAWAEWLSKGVETTPE